MLRKKSAVKLSYKEIEKELEKYPVIPEKLGIENIKNALKEIKNPQKNYKKIQVIGTNGKGCTAFLLSKIFSAHKLNTGLFISPHILTIREMISFDNRQISKRDFQEIYNELIEIFEKFKLTPFERLTVIAAEYFSRKNCDIAIFETGMGARLDAVTALNCENLVFTNISKDHTEFLGNSLEKIAKEKAYPILNARNIFSLPQLHSVKTTLIDFANKSGKNINFLEPPKEIKIKDKITTFKFKEQFYTIPMSGKHYAYNTSLAIYTAINLLKNFQYQIAFNALKKAFWKQAIHSVNLKDKKIIFSFAHNKVSINADIKTIKILVKQKLIKGNINVLFATSRKRPADKFLKIISKDFKDILVTKVPGYDYPFELIKKQNKFVTIEDYKKAIEKLIKDKKVKNILITGSIYFCGFIKNYLKKVKYF